MWGTEGKRKPDPPAPAPRDVRPAEKQQSDLGMRKAFQVRRQFSFYMPLHLNSRDFWQLFGMSYRTTEGYREGGEPTEEEQQRRSKESARRRARRIAVEAREETRKNIADKDEHYKAGAEDYWKSRFKELKAEKKQLRQAFKRNGQRKKIKV